MRTMNETFAAGEVKSFDIAGNYFELMSCASDLARVDWFGEDGQQVEPWQTVREGVFAAEPFRGFAIKNGATPQTIRFLVGNGTGGNRAAPVSGNVGILALPSGAEWARVTGGSCMAAASAVPNAGQNGQFGIEQPSNSGRDVAVKRVTLAAGQDVTVAVTVGVGPVVGSVNGKSKLIPGGGVPVSQAAKVFSRSVAGPSGVYLASIRLKAGAPHVIDWQEPVVLQKHAAANSTILMFTANTPDIVLESSIEWIEQ